MFPFHRLPRSCVQVLSRRIKNAQQKRPRSQLFSSCCRDSVLLNDDIIVANNKGSNFARKRLFSTGNIDTTTTTNPVTGNENVDNSTKKSSEDNINGASSPTEETLLKTRILRAALDRVKQYGWTTDAIIAGVQRELPQASTSLAGMVTPRDMVSFAMDDWNRRLAQELDEENRQQLEQQQQEQQQQQSQHQQQEAAKSSTEQSTEKQQPQTQQIAPSSSPLSPIDRITSALQRRLEYQKELIMCRQWQHGMVLGLSSPSQALQTTQQLKTLIQTVLSKTGELQQHSEGSQVALGAVYVATEFHMLADTSPNYEQTWQFLQARVQEWYSYQKQLGSIPFPSPPFNSGSNSHTSTSSPWLFPFVGGTSSSSGSVLSSSPRTWNDRVVLVSTVSNAFVSGIFSLLQINPHEIPRTANTVVTNTMSQVFQNNARPHTTTAPAAADTTKSSEVLDGTKASHYKQQQQEK